MKHIFIINPASGSGKKIDDLKREIEEYSRNSGEELSIYETITPGDATRYIKEYMDAHDEPTRFYACGGDGTINEVLSGVYLYDNAEMGVVPIGTGNDYIKNFTNTDLFTNVSAQIEGRAKAFDFLTVNGDPCANMVNSGFDCAVVEKTVKLKRRKLVPTSMAYIFGLVITLVKKPGLKCSVSVNGGEYEDRKLLLTCIANGSFCGGGFCSAPMGELNDGIMDVVLVKNVGRIKFLTMVSEYKKGTFLSNGSIMKVLDYRRCRQVDYKFSEQVAYCIDGEIKYANELHVRMVEKKMRMSLPEGVEYKGARIKTPTEYVKEELSELAEVN